MKNLIKNLVLFVGFSIVLSAFTGCDRTNSQEDVVKDVTLEQDTTDSSGGKSKLEADDPQKTDSSGGKGNLETDDPQKTGSEKGDKTKPANDEYPPAPKAIATAEIGMVDGETFKLEDNKGKVILVNLWAVWCGPCINEMPHLNELQEKFKDKDFVILGLNTGNDVGEKETETNIEKFVERQKLVYQIGWSERALTTEFFRLGQMNGIPQSFLIDRQGRLRGIFQGGSPKVVLQMKEVVETIVNEK